MSEETVKTNTNLYNVNDIVNKHLYPFLNADDLENLRQTDKKFRILTNNYISRMPLNERKNTKYWFKFKCPNNEIDKKCASGFRTQRDRFINIPGGFLRGCLRHPMKRIGEYCYNVPKDPRHQSSYIRRIENADRENRRNIQNQAISSDEYESD